MHQPCEACGRAEGRVVEPCDDARDPYRVCDACHRRLHARSLRPLEWFNLAKRHGWHQFLLHDDFYDEDGTATQPETRVNGARGFPAPTLAVVRQDCERLLDYSLTRWHLDPEVVAAWAEHDRRAVLPTLAGRFAGTAKDEIRARVLSICASAVREIGADFVRRAWEEYPGAVALIPLAEASAACLPHDEGFARVTTALAGFDGHEKRDRMFALSYFRSPDALAWIEQNVFEPIMETWGYLAAASHLDWLLVESWLAGGRPLSLVAIDALLAILRPRTPFLRQIEPTLAARPTLSRLREVMLQYRDRDPVPRVQQRIDVLLADAGQLANLLTDG
jgi:hypothetical protein